MGVGRQTGKIVIVVAILFAFLLDSCEKNIIRPADDRLIKSDITAPVVNSVLPANNAVSVATSTNASVTFSEKMNALSITTSTFTLKQGTTSIPGSVSSTGAVAIFTPSAALTANKIYTGTVTTGAKDSSGNPMATEYSWNFTTAADADTQAPTIISAAPANNAVAIPTNTKVFITFSEAMNTATIGASTITLKKGSTAVAGTVSYAGSVATFTPSSALASNTLYTGTVTNGVKDVAGNSLAANYSWSFTTAATADVTAPAISSVTPANNSSSIAVNTKPTASFSEAMNSGTITSSTFTMKQGSSSIAGTVTYSGSTATFTPSGNLSEGTVYTCTISTGAKDAAGNPIVADYTWTFTTVAAAPGGKSFSADVVPVLNLCNTCHTHGWTPSSTATTFYTNLVNSGYVKSATPTTSKIYVKLSGGHPPGSTVSSAQVNTILTWMTEGSKNN